jgi:large subunit ribosomal protein L7/L12
MGLIRKTLFMGTGGFVSPNSKKQRYAKQQIRLQKQMLKTVQSQQPVLVPEQQAPRNASVEKARFDVILSEAGEQRSRVIEVIQRATGFGPRYSAEMLEQLPQRIKEGLSAADAGRLGADLVQVGATVGLKVHHSGDDTASETSATRNPSTTESELERAEPGVGLRDDPLDQLRKLGELRDAGVLTDEEFEAKKAELLGRI